jgi:hypothetical protein
MRADVGKLYLVLTQEIGSYFRERRFKIRWLSFGLCYILLCQSYLIIMSSFKNGFLKILNNTQWIKVNSINISSAVFILFFNLSCWEDLRKMLNRKLLQRLKNLFIVIWLIGKEFFTIELNQKFQHKTCLCSLKTKLKLKIWWILLCNSEKFAITLIYLKGE